MKTVLLRDAAMTTDYVANGSFSSLKANVKYLNKPSYAMLLRLVDYNSGFKNNFVWVDKNSYDFLKKSSVRPGDIVIANVGANAGTVFRAPDLGVPMTLGPNSVLVRSKVSNDYLYYWLISPIGQSSLQSIVAGSAQPKFNKTDLRQIAVPNPKPDKQKRIGRVLKNIDEKIKLNRRMNETLEKIGQTLFKHYFITNPTDCGGVVLGQKIHPKRGKSLTSKNMVDGKTPVISGGLLPAGNHNTSNTTAPVVTISASGANAGFVALWGESVWSADSSFIDTTVTDHIYFYYIFLKLNQEKIFGMQTGAAQPHIYPSHLELLEIPNVPEEKIEEFNGRVSSIFEKIEQNKKEIQTLTSLRDSLLPRLISGKIKV